LTNTFNIIAALDKYAQLPSPYLASAWNFTIFTKGGHPQFLSATPQFRNIADNQNDCGIAETKLKKVAELRLRTIKI
jgi:hypothetical protein